MAENQNAGSGEQITGTAINSVLQFAKDVLGHLDGNPILVLAWGFGVLLFVMFVLLAALRSLPTPYSAYLLLGLVGALLFLFVYTLRSTTARTSKAPPKIDEAAVEAYAEWFSWVAKNLPGDADAHRVAARAAIAALRSGATLQEAVLAARASLGLPVIDRPPASRGGVGMLGWLGGCLITLFLLSSCAGIIGIAAYAASHQSTVGPSPPANPAASPSNPSSPPPFDSAAVAQAAAALFPPQGGHCGGACPATQRLIAQTNVYYSYGSDIFCRCPQGTPYRGTLDSVENSGQDRAVAHVVLESGGYFSHIDVVFVYAGQPGHWLADDVTCTGGGSATSIYTTQPPPCP